MRVLKERHGRRLTAATLELDARRARVGGTDGAAVILPPDAMTEAAGGSSAGGSSAGGNPGAAAEPLF